MSERWRPRPIALKGTGNMPSAQVAESDLKAARGSHLRKETAATLPRACGVPIRHFPMVAIHIHRAGRSLRGFRLAM